MSAETLSKKRKIVFWNPSHRSQSNKKRKLSTQRWFKHTKPIQKVDSTKNVIKIHTTKPTKPTKPKHNSKSSSSNINLPIPSKPKHTEYNLKSLQESTINKNTLNDHDSIDPINIKTRSNIICHNTEWAKLGAINKHLVDHITSFMCLSHPTMIQRATIPSLLQHSDALIKSETGSGKTLAYLIPIVSDLTRIVCTRIDGCRVMVIAPTRELTLQIYNVANVLCRRTPFIIVGHLMGGEDKKKEKQRLRKGLTIVIGTPGRILDHFENTKSFKFDLISWFVLDEADILLNLGFEPFIKSIVGWINKKRSVMQRCNVLVSATLDDKIQELAHFVLNKHTLISNNELDTYIPFKLTHDYLCVKRSYQSVALIGLLRMLYFKYINKWNGYKVIIFMSTCSVIHYFFSLFKECTLFPSSSEGILPSHNDNNIKWFELRGDMTQKDRTKTFFEFCDVTNGILFCTDVASRGLDIPKVNAIIQFNAPTKLKDYIHRSGRTARCGKAGQTILFLTPKEMSYLEVLKNNNFVFNEIRIKHIWNQLDIDLKKYNKNNKELSSSRNCIMDHLKSYVSNNKDLKNKGKHSLQTFIKAYTTYPKQFKSIFYVQNLDFSECCKCFFVEREYSFLKKGGMKNQIKQSKYFRQKSNMRDVAQKMTKKRNVPITISEFASM